MNGTLKLNNMIKNVNVRHALMPNCATARHTRQTVAKIWIPFQPNLKENGWAKQCSNVIAVLVQQEYSIDLYCKYLTTSA